MINGIIVQKKENRMYKGVEGENWFLENDQLGEYEDYYDEYIDVSWGDEQFVDVCNDLEYLRQYIAVSKEQGIDFRLILCETEKESPSFDLANIKDKVFIGYDYAYAGGSYYSAVYNDLVLRNFEEFKDIDLNSNGLLLSSEDLEKFIKARQNLEGKYEFECGDFIKYKLYEINI